MYYFIYLLEPTNRKSLAQVQFIKMGPAFIEIYNLEYLGPDNYF